MGRLHGNVETFPEHPGEWHIRNSDGGLLFWFGCPREDGRVCRVPLLPLRLENGAGWMWDGNAKQPTLAPSIDCVGGCGWHGFVKKGAFT